MSMHSIKKIDQKEYLKKYLSGDKKKKKKKDKKQKKLKLSTVKIVDDDINHVDCGIVIDEELLLAGEDAPQIVGEYIEERPQDDQKSNRWKSIVIKEEPNDNENNKDNSMWGHTAVEFNIKKERRSVTPDTIYENHKKYKKEKNQIHQPIKSSDYADYNEKTRRHRRNLTPDQSPPRKYDMNRQERHSNHLKEEDGSLKSRRHNRQSSSDQSPPRKQVHKLTEDSLKSSRRRHKSSNDTSSPRREDRSLKSRRNNRQSSSDQSPPRKQVHKLIEDSLKSSRRRHKSSNDTSSPRREERSLKSRRHNRPPSNNQSPSRKVCNSPKRNQDLKLRRHQHSSSSDYSPPRTQMKKSSEKISNSQSQLYRHSSSHDQSPSRISTKKNLRNLSPVMKNHRLSSDKDCNRIFQRSPQKIKRNNSFSSSSLNNNSAHSRRAEKSPSPPPTHKPKVSKTLDGKKAGLQNAAALKEETAERRLKEQQFVENMPSELSGRDAEVQVRSTGRLGRKARMAREENSTERKIREEKEQERKLKYERWGKGLKQIEDYRQRKADEEYESSKPLARYANDEDLDKYLREKEYAEDPMLEYMRQKRKEKEEQSDVPKKPIYEGPYPENRFGIRPGYRWDGVDRSNGYEKKWLTMQNERHAKREEAYKYSVEDM